jgi:hypothetical protein
MVISGTGRGALALFFASWTVDGAKWRRVMLKVPSAACYTMAAHRVLGLTAERASHVWKCPRCKEAPSKYRVWGFFGSSSTVSGTSTTDMLMDHMPMCPFSWYVIPLHDRIVHLSTSLKRSCLKRGLLRGGTCGWRSAGFGRELFDIDLGMWFG